MNKRTEFLLILAIAITMSLGVLVAYTTEPFEVLGFLCLDFFLIFYYLRLLIRENFGTLKFERENKDLIEKARAEISSSK
ncbi:MAG: hypothetical protein KGH72_03980 [Candidatus Micrarchaeota archaeon]|nr:hypothetical protein [Candidatus Micrarchaeota archaeon]